MKTALIVIAGIVLLVVVVIVRRYIAMLKGSEQTTEALFAQIRPIIIKLEAGETVPPEEIKALAESRETRSLLYRELRKIDRQKLFPEEYRHLEQIAESDLVAWLLHPNELDAIPNGIELAETIERTEGDPPEKYRFYVFKFRTLEPQWMAPKGWVAGVAGPYWGGQNPDISPPGVFSEFEPFNIRTPAEHLARIEQIVFRKLKWKV